MPIALPLLAIAALTSTGYGIASSESARHKAADERHRLETEKDRLNQDALTMEKKAIAEADAKLSEKRSRAGRSQSIATSPLGVTDAAPIAKASLSGKSLLGG